MGDDFALFLWANSTEFPRILVQIYCQWLGAVVAAQLSRFRANVSTSAVAFIFARRHTPGTRQPGRLRSEQNANRIFGAGTLLATCHRAVTVGLGPIAISFGLYVTVVGILTFIANCGRRTPGQKCEAYHESEGNFEHVGDLRAIARPLRKVGSQHRQSVPAAPA
jgi:hypothetical protein